MGKRQPYRTPKERVQKKHPTLRCERRPGGRGSRYAVYRPGRKGGTVIARAACAQEAWKRAAKKLKM